MTQANIEGKGPLATVHIKDDGKRSVTGTQFLGESQLSVCIFFQFLPFIDCCINQKVSEGERVYN